MKAAGTVRVAVILVAVLVPAVMLHAQQQGVAFDPETGYLYVPSCPQPRARSLFSCWRAIPNDPISTTCGVGYAGSAVVHVTELPVTPSGTPMTYMAEGRQFIVMAYGSGEESGLIGPGVAHESVSF